MNEANKEVALNLSRAIMTGQWDQVDALLADNFAYIGDDKPALNKVQYIGFMKNMVCAAMTQMDMKFLHVIAQGELVAVDYSNDMTHSGSFMGVPATGKRVHATGQFIREVKNGQVSAEWQTTNALGLIQQLGSTLKQG
jgi:predicted ester cyclase